MSPNDLHNNIGTSSVTLDMLSLIDDSLSEERVPEGFFCAEPGARIYLQAFAEEIDEIFIVRFDSRFQVGHFWGKHSAKTCLSLLALSLNFFANLLADLFEKNQLFGEVFVDIFSLFYHPRWPWSAKALYSS